MAEISVGAILEGSIKSITKFGAFVTLPGGGITVGGLSAFLQ